MMDNQLGANFIIWIRKVIDATMLAFIVMKILNLKVNNKTIIQKEG